jgi:anti-sigma28 factor (negative regulator of flagellin synthesis)
MDSVACLDVRESGLAVATAEQTSQIRAEKVLAIRARLAEGSYCVADRLDAALDRILEDLLQ